MALSHEKRVVVVCGQSGAGKSKAIDALEDIGFKTVDNLPVGMLEGLLPKLLESSPTRQLAVSLALTDLPLKEDLAALKGRLSKIVPNFWLYLRCDENTLCDRFSTTRRRHPYIDQGGELLAAIRREAYDLATLETIADTTFDTTSFTPHYLARSIEKTFASPDFARKLHVTFTSFGFKYGQLSPIDSLFDVRFLPNPYFDPKLKTKSGLTKQVDLFLRNSDGPNLFLEKLVDLFSYLIPNYYNEGKHYLRVGIGCTGGMHRSVWLAENLGEAILKKNLEHTLVGVVHRDLRANE